MPVAEAERQRATMEAGAAGLRVIFHKMPAEPEEKLHFGVELELETKAGRAKADIIRVLQRNNPEDMWGWKNDGSLTRGVECVTQPMTLRWFNRRFPFRMFERLKDIASPYDQEWHANGGIHIHMSRDAFASEKHLARFVYFHYANRALCTRVGDRDTSMGSFDINRPDYGGAGATIAELADQTKFGPNTNRYQCVNFNHPGTVELRYFRATTNVLRFRGLVEWAHAVFMFTKVTTKTERLNGEGLIAYMRRRPRKYGNALAVVAGLESHAGNVQERQPRHKKYWER